MLSKALWKEAAGASSRRLFWSPLAGLIGSPKDGVWERNFVKESACVCLECVACSQGSKSRVHGVCLHPKKQEYGAGI